MIEIYAYFHFVEFDQFQLNFCSTVLYLLEFLLILSFCQSKLMKVNETHTKPFQMKNTISNIYLEGKKLDTFLFITCNWREGIP